jgi:ATP-dependent Clp protease adapter protein ClpS
MSEFSDQEEGDVGVIEKPKAKYKKRFTKKWVIYILNNDVTSFEFVMMLLTDVFKRSPQECMKIAEQTHRNGEAVCFQGSKEKCGLMYDKATNAVQTLPAFTQGDRVLQFRLEQED